MIKSEFGSRIAIAHKGKNITYNELNEQVFAFASLLEGKRIDKVAIISENRPEWIAAFFAAWYHDITVVPIDFMASSDDIAYILNDCKPEFIFHSENNAIILKEAIKKTSTETETFCFGSKELPKTNGEWKEVSDLDKTAVIIYTSGTTGSPKGVMLSYKNLFINADAVTTDIPIYKTDSVVLLILPLQHIFPLLGAMIIPLRIGAKIAICPSLQASDIMETMQTQKVTLIIGVPRLYELIYKGVMAKINASAVTRTIYKVVKAINSPKLGKKVFAKIHEQFGGSLKTLVAGGAALPTEVGGFYDTIGFEVLEGYGMTESSPMISFTQPGDVIIGSTGKILPCLQVEIRDGEVVAKGDSIMKGYYNKPKETADTLKDGWLYTGDLGRIDETGHLYITGRKKEIIVLSNGKNINPIELEEKLVKIADGLIEEVGVAQHEGILHAVILPNFKALSNENIPDVASFFNELILTKFNTEVSPYKQISKSTIVKTSLPRTRLSKLQRFKLNEIITNGETKTERAPEPDTKEYKSIKKYLEDLLGKDVYADHHLVFDLALDSLTKLELIDYISRTFGIEIKEDELLGYTSVGELVQFISNHKEHFNEETVDINKIMTQPLDIELKKPWWTLAVLNSIQGFFLKMLFKIEKAGLEKLPEGAAIIAPNHSSFLDAFLITSFFNKKTINSTFFYAKKVHVDKFIVRGMAKNNNVIIMDLEKDLHRSIQMLAQVLREDKKLVIFPEGTRSRTGAMGDFKKTFAILSKELNVPIYPIAIKGAFEAWPRNKKMPILGSKLNVNFLQPILPDDMDELTLAEKVKQAIADTK